MFELKHVLGISLFLVLLNISLASSSNVQQYGVGIVVGIHSTTTTNPGPSCGNNVTSCGSYPSCSDLTQKSPLVEINSTGVYYCEKGKVALAKCDNNQAKKQIYMYNLCPTGSTTTTTLPGQTTTTLPGQTTTTTMPNQEGDFELEIEATDSDGNDKQIDLILYNPGTTNLINASSITGHGFLRSHLKKADARIDFDNSKFYFIMKNLDVEDASAVGLTIEKTTASVPDADVYSEYHVELADELPLTKIVLYFKYSGLSVNNEDDLAIYRCADYNPVDNTCDGDWTKLSSVSIDKQNKIVSVEISGFSVYALAEAQETTTTTTQSNGGSSGGGFTGSHTTTTTDEFTQDTFPEDSGTGSQDFQPEIVVTTPNETTNSTNETSNKNSVLFEFPTIPPFVLGFLVAIPAIGITFFVARRFYSREVYRPRYYRSRHYRVRPATKSSFRTNGFKPMRRSANKEETILILD